MLRVSIYIIFIKLSEDVIYTGPLNGHFGECSTKFTEYLVWYFIKYVFHNVQRVTSFGLNYACRLILV